MQQIPLQLAAKLRAGTLLTGARVSKVTRGTQSFQLEIEGMEKQEARAVVLAVRATKATRCSGELAVGVSPRCGPGTRPRHFIMPRSRRR
jgi:protoporphyrinogen oxidase